MADPTSIAEAQALYDAYCAAELAVLQSKSYTIAGRELTRENLSEIRKGKREAETLLQRLTAGSRAPRVSRVVYRDE